MIFPSLPRTEHTFKSEFWPSVISYKAFTAGQQTLLLQVSDPGTPESDRSAAMLQLFDQCVNAGAPFEQLPIGVVEEVFIHMRALSIGEIMKIRYRCNEQVEKEVPSSDGSETTIKSLAPCGQEIVVPIPLDKVKCIRKEGFKDVFDLPGGYHLKMRQPSYSNAGRLENTTSLEELIANFIDCLYDDDDQVWKIEDPDEPGIPPDLAIQRREVKKEFVKWVGDNIEDNVISSISKDFFRKIPRVFYETKIKCPGCGKQHEIKFNGIDEIFI